MISIIFDVDDTLYDQMIPFRSACRQVYGEKASLLAEQIYRAFHTRGNEVFEASQRGEMSMTDMRVYRISKAMEDCKMMSSRQEALDFQACYAENQKKIFLPEMIKDCLDICKKAGVAMGVMTNGPSAHQRRKLESLGLSNWIPEQNMFISEEVGFAKPKLGFFQAVENAMGLEKSESYMIGDSYINDIAGAMQMGWNTIWLNRRSMIVDKLAGEPDYVVENEAQLKELLQKIVCCA